MRHGHLRLGTINLRHFTYVSLIFFLELTKNMHEETVYFQTQRGWKHSYKEIRTETNKEQAYSTFHYLIQIVSLRK